MKRTAIILGLLCLILCGCKDREIPPHTVKSYSDASALLLWLSTIAIAGFGACVAAAVFLPVKKLALAGCAGFASMLGLALTTKAALPYLPWVALALGIIGVALGIFYFRRWVTATKMAVAYGIGAAKAETDQQISDLKIAHAAVQTDLGVKPLIDSVLASLKGTSNAS